ncbi:hypothetical protein FB645_006109 [Coemansia sp. IMI 203386]|nr:hypothetical protein FB645_006109 [Coemansia sp. IMI 203386]
MPGEYARLLAFKYVPIYDVIERDVSRCYPEHVLFVDADGQGQLFKSLLRKRNPRLHVHFSEQGRDALMYATPWFRTIFTLSLPWESALRVWDWFIYRRTKGLLRVVLAITDLANNHLITACPTIAEQLGFLLHIPPSLVRADTLITAAIQVKLSEQHI